MTAISSSTKGATPSPGSLPGNGHGDDGLGATRSKAAAPLLPSLLDENFGQMTWKAVYTIVERGINKRHFVRIGVAFVNRDGSLNVKLDAVPVNGQLHIRDAPPRDGREGREGRESIDPFISERDRERNRNREVNAPF